MYKKILVPIDGSHPSKRGLSEAIRLAKHHKARLRLIHVVDVFIVTPSLESGRYVDEIQKSFREVGSRLLNTAEALVRKHGLTVDSVMFEIVGGRAAEIIVAQAKKWRADIIVIGTHGRRGVSRLVMGSDAEEVVRTSPVPVLLVRTIRSGRSLPA
jgi:nucleotide-binding universal stress UspA family protein